jgi:hypothetical protein
MAFPDLAVNALYTVLCLVPGFISLTTVRHVANVDADMTEFEKSTWSFIASGVSLSLLYFLYVAWMSVVTGRFDLVRSLDIGWVEVVVIYPLLLFVAVVVGYVTGKIFDRAFATPSASPAEPTQ